ncbi:restriction endonuclease subunit S [Veillonella parvula]|uniref:restriction endonuclease subunit S n=1 Tax=Veillonella TaxID=29465 RepID=UPI00257D27F8|nr:restriction endonuclease subunit S [Veillonella sp.]
MYSWEQRKLSEVTTCFDNLRVPVTASDRVPGKIPYYGANGIQDYVSGHTHSGEFVLIAEDGANDLNDYPIQYVNGAIWVNNHAHVIAGYKEKLENKFLSYSLKTVKMTTFIVGSGRSKLNLKALLEIPISMPNYDEQCVIGKFIETIDINITLHQQEPFLCGNSVNGGVELC